MLSDLGFEQAVLPREWSCQDIAAVRDKTPLRLEAVSYTHLDVYKRQPLDRGDTQALYRRMLSRDPHGRYHRWHGASVRHTG